MRTLPSPTAVGVPPASPAFGSVVVIYDTFASALHGQAFCACLAERFGVEDGSLEELYWPAHALEDGANCHEAAEGASAADYVVVALRAGVAVPEGMANWLREWMPAAARRDITLVVLQDASDEGVLDFMQTTARELGVDAIGNHDHRAEPEGAILVVEDNPNLRELVASFLADTGHRTLVANDGVEARELIETHAEDLALVITDIEMPRLRGDDLAVWIRERHPAIKVLLMSSAEPEAPGTRLLPYLAKPFQLVALLSAVEDLLGQVI
ncbi:MAG: response regulator [Chthoniobacter sp.]|nr:response regulator [Chthoniobacter sp.]